MHHRSTVVVTCFVALCAAAASTIACSSKTASAPDAGPSTGRDAGKSGHDAGIPVDAAVAVCNGVSIASCARLGACYPDDLSARYGDGGACIERTSLPCVASLQVPHSGRTTADEVACAASFASQSCGDFLNGDTTDACAPVAGSLGSGSACAFSSQCQSQFCGLPLTSSCGVCQSTPAPDASCADLSSCGNNLSCYKFHCVRYTADGGVCSGLQGCGEGLSCVMAADAGTGTCQPEGQTTGAACDSKHEIAAACSLAKGLYCVDDKRSAKDKTCQPVTTVGAGQPCGYLTGGGYNVCVDDSSCYKVATADGGVAGACVANAKDGAKCNTASGPDCDRPARCVGSLIDGGSEGTCMVQSTTSCPGQ